MVKTKRSAQDAVYDVLATLKDGVALTSREIYNDLEPADQGLFVGGIDGVMKSINKLHTRGIVVNGNSEIVNGRVVKTWRLRNEVSSHQSVVDAVAEAVEAEPVKVYQTEAEREYSIPRCLMGGSNTAVVPITHSLMRKTKSWKTDLASLPSS